MTKLIETIKGIKKPLGSSLLIPTKQMAVSAYHLVEMENVSVFEISDAGILSGMVLCPKTFLEFRCSITLHSSGIFYINSEDDRIENHDIFHLAVLLKFIQLKSEKKYKKVFNQISQYAPAWIKNSMPFDLDFTSEDNLENDPRFQNIQGLEAFWFMKDTAYHLEKKYNVSAEKLVLHIFNIYSTENFSVLRSGMEALILYFKMAINENIVIATKPDNKIIFGRYKVRERNGVCIHMKYY